MNTAPAPPANAPDAPHPASEFAATLDTIFASFLLVIAAQFRVLGLFTHVIWNRFSHARVRLARLLAQLAAGTWRPARPRAPRSGQRGGPRPPYSPQGHLWLIRKAGYYAAGHGAQLNHLLHSPQTQALLATAPPEALASMARTLRPLCHLLGITLPAPLLLSPRARREPEGGQPARAKPQPTPKPKPAPLPKLLPLYPQRRPRLILYPDPPRKRRPT